MSDKMSFAYISRFKVLSQDKCVFKQCGICCIQEMSITCESNFTTPQATVVMPSSLYFVTYYMKYNYVPTILDCGVTTRNMK